MRCSLGCFALAAAALSFDAAAAGAPDYPNRPVRLVTPFPAGGVVDFFARLVAEHLSRRLGQQVLVDNRAGAAGIVGFEHVAKSPADGYTLIVGSAGTTAINPALYKTLPYDPVRDFVGITLIGVGPVMMAVHPSVPAQSVKALIGLARARPGALNYGSAGSGSTSHLATESFRHLAGVSLTHVPYKGSAPGITALVAGEVSVFVENIPPFVAHLKSNRVRALAVTGTARYPTLPQIPTFSESGLDRYDASGWWAVLAPAHTPPAIVERLQREISSIVGAGDVRERMVAQGALPSGIGGDALADFLRAEQRKWARVVQDSGARID